MFNQIKFFFDENGEYRGDYIEKEGRYNSIPLLLKAEHCNAKCFVISNSTTRSDYGSVPSIQIWRSDLKSIEKDLYNDDGRPATLMFVIAIPYFEHCENSIWIEGLEQPNLSYAGRLVKPYYDNIPRIQGIDYIEKIDHLHYQKLKRQRIILSKV